MKFTDGIIEDVRIEDVPRYTDDRGWLMETFRHDELRQKYYPVMGYTSLTVPGQSRGPHEHVDQADLFVFMGPGKFKMWLWDNRKDSATYMHRCVFTAGEGEPKRVLVPKGVAHAYKNIGDNDAVVQNFPNRLYAGEAKKEPVDEIRHEDDPNTIFQLV